MVDLSKINKYFENSKIPKNMLKRGQLVLNEFLKPIKILFEQKALPDEPWSQEQIKYLLDTLSHMDTDKDRKAARVGEREARIASKLNLEISAGFCHGIGRSGFLTDPQPKAPGGSIMYDIANYVARDFLRKFGLPNIKKAIVVPIATGMSLALCLAALRPDWDNGSLLHKRKILVPRIDHKSLIKGIKLVGVTPKIIDGRIFGDSVRVPIEDIKEAFDEDCFGIISVTSFFPPREHDALKKISKFAKKKDLCHIVINAYGVQSPEWMKLIRSAIDAGRVDAIIQSTDKNVLTPVGGAVIASPSKKVIDTISQTYAGRASATPVVNFLVSILSLGKQGYEELIDKQQRHHNLLRKKLQKFAEEIDERILDTFNPVAIAMTLNHLPEEKLTQLGGALYNLRVTGPRVYNPDEKMFGFCCEDYPYPYIVMNAAIGSRKSDILTAIERLKKAYAQVKKTS
ncbi:MAG: O-phosphoseryl-tRNA(Sec) selenium transferase [Promethearchaeia archaeon]